MKLTFAVLLVIAGAGAQAQERELTLSAGYPAPVGDNFMAQSDGVASGAVAFGQPVGAGVLVRLGVQYNRVRYASSGTSTDVYTPRVSIARPIAIAGQFNVVPEVGVSYTRIAFMSDDVVATDDHTDGAGFWVGVTPRYILSNGLGVGASIEYRATFLETPGGQVLDIPYNREYRAVVVGVEASYSF